MKQTEVKKNDDSVGMSGFCKGEGLVVRESFRCAGPDVGMTEGVGDSRDESAFADAFRSSAERVPVVHRSTVAACAGFGVAEFSELGVRRMVTAYAGAASTPVVHNSGVVVPRMASLTPRARGYFRAFDDLAERNGYCYLWLFRGVERKAVSAVLGPSPSLGVLFQEVSFSALAVREWRRVYVVKGGGEDYHLTREVIPGAPTFAAVLARVVASFAGAVPDAWAQAVSEECPANMVVRSYSRFGASRAEAVASGNLAVSFTQLQAAWPWVSVEGLVARERARSEKYGPVQVVSDVGGVSSNAAVLLLSSSFPGMGGDNAYAEIAGRDVLILADKEGFDPLGVASWLSEAHRVWYRPVVGVEDGITLLAEYEAVAFGSVRTSVGAAALHDVLLSTMDGLFTDDGFLDVVRASGCQPREVAGDMAEAASHSRVLDRVLSSLPTDVAVVLPAGAADSFFGGFRARGHTVVPYAGDVIQRLAGKNYCLCDDPGEAEFTWQQLLRASWWPGTWYVSEWDGGQRMSAYVRLLVRHRDTLNELRRVGVSKPGVRSGCSSEMYVTRVRSVQDVPMGVPMVVSQEVERERVDVDADRQVYTLHSTRGCVYRELCYFLGDPGWEDETQEQVLMTRATKYWCVLGDEAWKASWE
jgi:hypothetical protein